MFVILPRFILDEKTNDSYFKIMNHGCNSPGGSGDTQQLYSGKWNRLGEVNKKKVLELMFGVWGVGWRDFR